MKTRPIIRIADRRLELQSAVCAIVEVHRYFGTLTDVSVLLRLTDEQIQRAPEVNDYRIRYFCAGCCAGLYREYPAHRADEYCAFLNQLHAMQMESWRRALAALDEQTTGLWVEYWKIIIGKCGGSLEQSKAHVRDRFSGLEAEYGAILNEAYKIARI